MTAFTIAAAALIDAIHTDDLPEPVSVSWAGYCGLSVQVQWGDIGAWETSAFTAVSYARENWQTAKRCHREVPGAITGTDVPMTLTTIIELTLDQSDVRRKTGLSAEEIRRWFDDFPGEERHMQLILHADMVRMGAPADLLPKVRCEHCPEMVTPFGGEAICGEHVSAVLA